MADQPKPEDLDTEPVALADIDVKQVAQAAKGTFSLSDRLQGIKFGREKIVLFTDVDAVRERTALNNALTGEADRIARMEPGAEKDLALDEFMAQEEQLEKLTERMLKSALAVHLRGLPQIALKVARRKANKAHEIPGIGVPPESQTVWVETYNQYLIAQAIEKVVDAEGNEADLGPNPAETLETYLPPSQWDRFFRTWEGLIFKDEIGKAATDDPGF